VRSYLQWLQDSDFDSTCALCKQPLTQGDVIRLPCLDLFHTACVDKQCSAMPETTALAGYTCVTCQAPLIPPENASGPIAQRLRSVYADTAWMRRITASLRHPTATTTSLVSPVKPTTAVAHEVAIPMQPLSGHQQHPQRRASDADDDKYSRRQPSWMTSMNPMAGAVRRMIRMPAFVRRHVSNRTAWILIFLIVLMLIFFFGSTRSTGDAMRPTKSDPATAVFASDVKKASKMGK